MILQRTHTTELSVYHPALGEMPSCRERTSCARALRRIVKTWQRLLDPHGWGLYYRLGGRGRKVPTSTKSWRNGRYCLMAKAKFMKCIRCHFAKFVAILTRYDSTAAISVRIAACESWRAVAVTEHSARLAQVPGQGSRHRRSRQLRPAGHEPGVRETFRPFDSPTRPNWAEPLKPDKQTQTGAPDGDIDCWFRMATGGKSPLLMALYHSRCNLMHKW